MKKIAVYPGSFDPITNGHIDIITRALRMFDELIVLVAYNPAKTSLFTVEERMVLIRDVLGRDEQRLHVDCSAGLLVDYVRSRGANVILRGLRAVSDFEYEFQMAGMNRNLYPEVETVFLTPGEQYMFISATMVREIALLGGDVSKFVQPAVAERLAAKVSEIRQATSA